MQKSHIKIQFERLKRHYKLAKEEKDKIAFLDLAHSLRIWSELKEDVDKLIEEEGFVLSLRNKINNKKLKEILKGTMFFDVPLASVDSEFTPEVQVKGVQIVNKALSPEEIKKMFEVGPPKEQVTRLTFTQWLGSEIISTSDPKDNSYVGISREILIKRIANLLGASHPEGKDNSNDYENKFDAYVKELNKIEVANGYPLTHYQLMEIAGSIIESLDQFLKE